MNHAFASTTGRHRLVERAWTPENPEEGPEIPGTPSYMAKVQENHPEDWEWLNLAGFADVDFPISGITDSQFEIRPEHRRGDEFIAQERELLRRLSRDGMRHRLRDALVHEDLQLLLADINEICLKLRFDPDHLRQEGALTRLHRELPSRDVLVELRCLRLQDPSFPLEQHDRVDLLSLAVALVYCDIVITERRWTHLSGRARVGERYGTEVAGNLGGLLAFL